MIYYALASFTNIPSVKTYINYVENSVPKMKSLSVLLISCLLSVLNKVLMLRAKK